MTHTWIRMSMFALAATTAFAVEAGDLKGKFVLDGDAPAPTPVTDPRAASDFPSLKLNYENLVVDPTTKGIANIAVYVRTKEVAVTPEAAAAAPAEIEVDNNGGQFKPHITGLWVGKQNLFFKNSDPVPHNSNFPAAGVNPLIPVNARMPIPVAGEKLIPQELSCNIHPWMKGYVVLREHPYTAVSGTDGSFVIKNLPDGTELEFQVWHEKAGYLEAQAAWPKGRFMMTLKAGENDLGEVKVPVALFNK